MEAGDKKEEERPVAYPKPTEADKQLKDQPEYIDQEPNKFEKEISDGEKQVVTKDISD
jgi:hypothetical protein